MLDVWVDKEVERPAGAVEGRSGCANGKVLDATALVHRDMNSILEEIVRCAVAIATAGSIANVGDVEAQVENIRVGGSIVNYLHIR
jgi:hypothetical protein